MKKIEFNNVLKSLRETKKMIKRDILDIKKDKIFASIIKIINYFMIIPLIELSHLGPFINTFILFFLVHIPEMECLKFFIANAATINIMHFSGIAKNLIKEILALFKNSDRLKEEISRCKEKESELQNELKKITKDIKTFEKEFISTQTIEITEDEKQKELDEINKQIKSSTVNNTIIQTKLDNLFDAINQLDKPQRINYMIRLKDYLYKYNESVASGYIYYDWKRLLRGLTILELEINKAIILSKKDEIVQVVEKPQEEYVKSLTY